MVRPTREQSTVSLWMSWKPSEHAVPGPTLLRDRRGGREELARDVEGVATPEVAASDPWPWVRVGRHHVRPVPASAERRPIPSRVRRVPSWGGSEEPAQHRSMRGQSGIAMTPGPWPHDRSERDSASPLSRRTLIRAAPLGVLAMRLPPAAAAASTNDPDAITGVTGGDVSEVELGGIVYRFHVFSPSMGDPEELTVGTIPGDELDVDVLLVAGGGGGGRGSSTSWGAGGGGAGGLVTATITLDAMMTYPIVVGRGGAGARVDGEGGRNGWDTAAFGRTAIGGGAGARQTMGATTDGGSGGGAYNGVFPTGTGAALQPSSPSGGLGSPGGGAASGAGGGGGGGAAGAGAAATGSESAAIGGAGGAGSDRSAMFSTAFGADGVFAGGGGGSSGNTGAATPAAAAGGGGRGGWSGGQAGSGLAGTGGGGGGGIAHDGGDGGSGIVIVRYRLS